MSLLIKICIIVIPNVQYTLYRIYNEKICVQSMLFDSQSMVIVLTLLSRICVKVKSKAHQLNKFDDKFRRENLFGMNYIILNMSS